MILYIIHYHIIIALSKRLLSWSCKISVACVHFNNKYLRLFYKRE